jgi:hypothetical protein
MGKLPITLLSFAQFSSQFGPVRMASLGASTVVDLALTRPVGPKSAPPLPPPPEGLLSVTRIDPH